MRRFFLVIAALGIGCPALSSSPASPDHASLPAPADSRGMRFCLPEELRCLDQPLDSCLPSNCSRGADRCLALKHSRRGEAGEWIFRRYTFDRFLTLNETSSPRSVPRSRLEPPLLQRIDHLESSAGASIDGYLLDVRRVKRDRKTCLAGGMEAFELRLGGSPAMPPGQGIRARLTPGILSIHPGWTLPRLRPWRARGREDAPRIRIRGYLLYNNLIASEVATRRRPTAWEISPVTDILLCPSTWECGASDSEGWLELDTFR